MRGATLVLPPGHLTDKPSATSLGDSRGSLVSLLTLEVAGGGGQGLGGRQWKVVGSGKESVKALGWGQAEQVLQRCNSGGGAGAGRAQAPLPPVTGQLESP